MTEKEYKKFLEYSQKEELRLNARYYCLMGMSWEELNKADHETLLELGNKVTNEESSINLYMLDRNEQARLKMWELVAQTALFYIKKFPTADRLKKFTSNLEEHYQNIISKALATADQERLDKLIAKWEVPSELSSGLRRALVLGGIV